MKLSHNEAEDVREVMQGLPPFYLKEMFRAFRLLDTSLTMTIGENWLDKVGGNCIPHDLYSVMTGNLAPDENGVMRSQS